MSTRDDEKRDAFTDTLSDYLDGDLPPGERRTLETHLESCAACRTTLHALQAVKERAHALVDPPAPDDLWAGIASRIGSAGSMRAEPPRVVALPARRAPAWFAFAAAAAVVVVAAGAMWVVRGLPERTLATHAPAPAPVRSPAETAAMASFDPVQVEGEIAQLQAALDHGRGKLDPKTVAVLEKNLKVIRAATEDARRALDADPANRDLRDYFAVTVQSKLDLMRRASALAGV